MASRRESLSAQKGRQESMQRYQEKRPRGIKKEGPRQVRRSAHFEGLSELQNSSEDRNLEQRHSSLSTEENHPPPLPLKGQKRPREVEHPANHIPTERPQKLLRSLPSGPSRAQTFDQEAASGPSASKKSHISVGKLQGIKKQQAIRKSAYPQAIQQLHKQSISKSNHIRELQAPPSPPASKFFEGGIILRRPSKLHQKLKRGQEAGQSSPEDRERPPSKQPRTSSPSCTAEGGLEKEAESDSKKNVDPVETWIQSDKWPSECFEQDSQVREDFEHDSWLEEQMEQSTQVPQYVEINGTRYPRPIKKVPLLRRKQSDISLTGSSDQKKRESKSAPYRDTRYNALLAAKGSYMREFDDDDIPKNIKDLCQTLLERDQTIPENSLFRDDLFKRTSREIEDRNEAMIIQDITRLIVPSAKNLAIYGARHLDHLIENVNEGWTGSIPVEGPRPQPDYSVGFRRSAFTEEQLNKLDPLIGSVYDTSFFIATYRMYFPFLTCEVKCGAAALDIADRQNTHSMTLAVRGVVELFRLVKREKELHREILAFSISHDHCTVRIYGHYSIIDGNKITFYRHPIHEFSFTALDGMEKWRAYMFTKNVYDIWMPIHRKRICSVIDQLPSNVNFEVAQGSELQFPEASGLSQELGGLLSEPSNVESASGASHHDNELVSIIQHADTPNASVTSDTSLSQGKDQAALKRPKRRHAAK